MERKESRSLTNYQNGDELVFDKTFSYHDLNLHGWFPLHESEHMILLPFFNLFQKLDNNLKRINMKYMII